MTRLSNSVHLPSELDELLKFLSTRRSNWSNMDSNLQTYKLTGSFVRRFRNFDDKYAIILIIEQLEVPSRKNVLELVNFFNEVINNIGIVSNKIDLVPYLIVDAIKTPGTNLAAADKSVADVLNRIGKLGGKIYVASGDKMVKTALAILKRFVTRSLEVLPNLDEALIMQLESEGVDIGDL